MYTPLPQRGSCQRPSDGRFLLCGFRRLKLSGGTAERARELHLMARVVKWKSISPEQLDSIGITPDCLLLRSNSLRCHSSQYTGHIGNHNSFTLYSLKSVLRPKVRHYVTVKVHNTDADESCSSKFAYEDNESCSSGAYQSTEGNQLKALEAYFSKRNSEKAQHPCSWPQNQKYKNSLSSPNEDEASIANVNANFKSRLDSLQIQFNKGNTGTKSYRSTSIEDYKDFLVMDEKNFLDMHKDDETSGFCLINLLAEINIAVLLFEIASPVKNSENEYLSLPLMYGAKVNDLILSGEWWRLLTPMCLHSGFLHIALGCWVLLTFGPRVCRAYGQMTFFLIYLLGGVCGNLTSFLHTPELTVCGTGPVFSLIGAWLVYQSQNKQVIERDVSETMFWQAVIAAALSLLLSMFGRIDNWTHLGATISGLFFGYLTCPSIELDNSAKTGQEEAVALVRRQANPCRSIAIFSISVVTLAVLVFATQLNILDLD
ncbi:hypothetical protein ACP4OV_012781 [Aristida adscensionis]